MTRRQTLLLILLGALDLAVLILLGATVLQTRESQPLLSPVPAACPALVLDALPAHLAPHVAWQEKRLTLSLTARYPTAEPPPGSAQLLWPALESLRRAANAGCALPAEIRVSLAAHGQSRTVSHVVRVEGETLAAWLQEALTEEEFIARAGYYSSDVKERAVPPLP